MPPFPQFLIDVGIYTATRIIPKLVPEEIIEKLTAIFSALLSGGVQYDEAVIGVTQLGYDAKGVTKIWKIMKTKSAVDDEALSGSTEPVKDRVSHVRRRSPSWSAEEDDRLLAAIYQYGLSDWLRVCQFVGGGRSRAQCGQRWQRCLDPNMRKDKWSTEEDAVLMRHVASYGEHAWAKVAKEIEHRTDVQCRYRYSRLNGGVTRPKGRNVMSGAPVLANNWSAQSIPLVPVPQVNTEDKPAE